MTKLLKTCSKRTFRDRYYSSMNFEEYYLLFGPPTPLVKYQFLYPDPSKILHKTFPSYVCNLDPNNKNSNFLIKAAVWTRNIRLQTRGK